MKVFRLAQDLNRFTALAMVHEPDLNVSFEFGERRLAPTWRRYAVRPITEEFPELTEVGDFTTLGTIPVFTERAVAVLGELLAENGEILPLECSVGGTSYYAYNVTTVVDALNRDKTKALWLDRDRIMVAERYAFKAERLAAASIFRIPELRAVFVTDVFVDRVRRAWLKGFAPELVWTEESA